MDLLSSSLLPDRHRSTITYRCTVGAENFIVKRYINFDVQKLWNHLKWIQSLSLPILPKGIDLKIFDRTLELTYQEVPGRPLWDQARARDFRIIRSQFMKLIATLESQSKTVYNHQLPPGIGIVHKDLHMGNVISNGDELFLIDLENIDIGPFELMRREFALNIIGDPEFSLDQDRDLTGELIQDLCLEATTTLSYFKAVETVIAHFYDYYREKEDYFKKEKRLKELLVEQGLSQQLPRL